MKTCQVLSFVSATYLQNGGKNHFLPYDVSCLVEGAWDGSCNGRGSALFGKCFSLVYTELQSEAAVKSDILSQK